ncbi:hypothetical protein [Geodermatophilus sp. CPCC 206100]|uniref:hypothetical protein n=1 Tax=Geodermatophilus sp. CPCC 206100 TaxID=3020054 RepID=UPI003B0002AC
MRDSAAVADAGRRSPREVPESGDDRSVSWVLGAVLVLGTTAVAALMVPDLRHWFLVPVTACGLLVAPDAVDWVRGRLDVFDPQALTGLVGVHFFFVTPLLHVGFDYWAKYVDGSADWRTALGRMALVNLLGLTVYRAVLAPRPTRAHPPLPSTDVRRLGRLSAAVAVLGALSFALLVARMGGPAAYVEAMADDRSQLQGLGPALLVSTAFPIALLVLALVRLRDRLRRRPAAVVLVLVPYALLELLVGGLGGSRSHTVWCLVVGVGLCHFLVAPVRRRTLVVLTVALVGFLYLYGFYKAAGSDALEAIGEGASLSELSSDTGRDMRSVLLGDLGRADVQALLLERQQEGRAPVAHGATYLGDLTFLVPDSLGLGRIPDKIDVGTDMLYGSGSHRPDFASSYVYGLGGEAVLNFGAAGAVLAFLPFALVVRGASSYYRRCLTSPHAPGAALVAPGLSLAAALALTSDLDNVTWFLLNYVAVFALLALGSRVRARAGETPPAERAAPGRAG